MFPNPFTAVRGGRSGVAYPLGANALPIIGISSGSVSAPGAVTAFTALAATQVYTGGCYCYYPANILATSIAAGFYFTQILTTTTATAYLNQLTSWPPTIPATLTPVTDGRGAFTGDLTEEFLPAIAVPAFDVSSALYLATAMYKTNGGSGTVRARLSGQAGTIIYARVGSTGGIYDQVVMQNMAARNAQIVLGVEFTQAGAAATFGAGGSGAIASPTAIDTSIPTSLVFSIQRATATDNMILNYLSATLAP